MIDATPEFVMHLASQWPSIPVLQPIEAECRAMPHLPDWDDLKPPTDWKAKKLIKCDTCDYWSNQPAWRQEWQCQVCLNKETED
ncbi:unnamed protein product [Sphagnum balticum]